jgi:hypothetical protein
MAGEYNFLNYYTEYEAHGDFNKEKDHHACFAMAFKDVEDYSHVSYKIYIYKELKNGHSNFCTIQSKKELEKYIGLVKSLFKFKFKVEETEAEYIVSLELNNLRNIYHRYILTWIRYSYEYPYNVLMADAIKLRKNNKRFRCESLFNLFLLVSQTFSKSGGYYGTGHAISENGKFIRLKGLRKNLDKKSYMNDLVRDSSSKGLKSLVNMRHKNKEYWNDEYEDREKVYLYNYKYKKEHEKAD